MAAMTSYHADLVNANTTSFQHIWSSSRQFPIYSIFVLVRAHFGYSYDFSSALKILVLNHITYKYSPDFTFFAIFLLVIFTPCSCCIIFLLVFVIRCAILRDFIIFIHEFYVVCCCAVFSLNK